MYSCCPIEIDRFFNPNHLSVNIDASASILDSSIKLTSPLAFCISYSYVFYMDSCDSVN